MSRSNKYQDAFFIYPRDRDGKRMNLTICVINRGGRMYQGQALLGEGDTFCYETGRNLAYSRAVAAFNKVQGLRKKNSEEIIEFEGTLEEGRKAFGGGRFA